MAGAIQRRHRRRRGRRQVPRGRGERRCGERRRGGVRQLDGELDVRGIDRERRAIERTGVARLLEPEADVARERERVDVARGAGQERLESAQRLDVPSELEQDAREVVASLTVRRLDGQRHDQRGVRRHQPPGVAVKHAQIIPGLGGGRLPVDEALDLGDRGVELTRRHQRLGGAQDIAVQRRAVERRGRRRRHQRARRRRGGRGVPDGGGDRVAILADVGVKGVQLDRAAALAVGVRQAARGVIEDREIVVRLGALGVRGHDALELGERVGESPGVEEPLHRNEALLVGANALIGRRHRHGCPSFDAGAKQARCQHEIGANLRVHRPRSASEPWRRQLCGARRNVIGAHRAGGVKRWGCGV